MKLSRLPVVLGFLVLLLTLPAAVFLLQQRQQVRVAAGIPNIALVYLWPQNFSLAVGQEVTMEIKVDSKGQAARRAEATLKFNPRLIKIAKESILAPERVSLVQKVLNETEGVLQLSGVGDFTEQQTLASFKIEALGKGKTNIEIGNARVWDASGTVDIFGSSRDATIKIQ